MTLIEAWQALQDAAPYIVAILVATTALARVAQRAAHALDRWAAASAYAWDDEPASAVARAADALVRALDWLSALLPRIGFGSLSTSASAAAKKRAERDDRRGPPGAGGAGAAGAAILALVIAAGAAPLTACGGPPREAREAAEGIALAVDRADVLVAARLERRGAEARASMLEQVARGAITSVEEGLAYLDEQLAPERTAVRVLRVARAALLTAEDALDAWDSSAAGDGLLVPAACVVAALEDVAEALDALGVEVPEAITSGAVTIARFAGPLCPAPAFAAVPS